MTLEYLTRAKDLESVLWPGNLSKTWITNAIARQAHSCDPVPLRVVDLGCGDGGVWTRLLSARPNVELTLWDPVPSANWPQYEKDSGGGIRFLARSDDIPTAHFDVVSSLSVIEHVSDLQAHLALVFRTLRPGGIAYLLWDDGHFRPSIDARSPLKSGSLAFKEVAKWGASSVFGGRVPPRYFQKPRSLDEVATTAQAVGLSLAGSYLLNLPSVKRALGILGTRASLGVWNRALALELSINEASSAAHDREETDMDAVLPSRLLVAARPD